MKSFLLRLLKTTVLEVFKKALRGAVLELEIEIAKQRDLTENERRLAREVVSALEERALKEVAKRLE